jgi:hypothetical protein
MSRMHKALAAAICISSVWFSSHWTQFCIAPVCEANRAPRPLQLTFTFCRPVILGIDNIHRVTLLLVRAEGLIAHQLAIEQQPSYMCWCVRGISCFKCG